MAGLLLALGLGCGERAGLDEVVDDLNGGLTGQLAAASWSVSETPHSRPPEVLHAAAREARTGGVEVRFRGLLRAERGDLAGAAGTLSAAALASERWQDYNDLAVIHNERAAREHRPLDRLRALDAIERARRLSTAELEPVFNLALFAEELGLRRVARRAWEELLALPAARSELPAELRGSVGRRIERLARPSSAERWQSHLALLEKRDAEPTAVARAVAEHPYYARRYAQHDLLERWLSARRSGDAEAAAETLAVGLGIGFALAGERGDQMVLDTYRALATPTDGAIVTAVGGYCEGLAAFLAGDYARSVAAFDRSIPILDDRIPSLGRLASYYRVYASFRGGAGGSGDGDGERYLELAVERLESLLTPSERQRYPSLAGRVEWRRGIAQGIAGRSAEAIERFHTGRELLERTSGDELAGIGDMLLAEEYGDIRDVEKAWEHRLGALRRLSFSGEIYQVQAVLHHAARELVAAGLADAARPFVDEMMLLTEEAGELELAVYSRLCLGEYLGATGRRRAALEELERARDLVHRLSTPPRADLLATLDSLVAEVLVTEDPGRAVELLDRLVARFAAAEDGIQLVPALEARAQALIAFGRVEPAAADLEAVIAAVESERAAVDRASRPFAFLKAQGAFDALARLHWRAGQGEKALAVVERARARHLLDLRGDRGRSGKVLTGPEIAGAAPPGVLLVVYAAVAPGERLVWVVGESGITPFALATPEVGRITERYVAGLEAGHSDDELEADARRLYGLLLEPLGMPLASVHSLVIAPDRELAGLPFASLRDGSGRFLIDSVAVATVPSVSLFAAAGAAPSRAGFTLVVADPLLEGGPHERLPRLQSALEEGERVARQYPESLRLTGDRATRKAVIDGLRASSVLHFAGHALADGETVEASVLPLAASGEGGGELTTADLQATEFDLRLVVLSACRTVDGLTVGREGSLGLAAFFFALGADAVIATRWPALDAAGPPLMERVHFHFSAGRRAAESLRLAVLENRRALDLPVSVWANYLVLENARSLTST